MIELAETNLGVTEILKSLEMVDSIKTAESVIITCEDEVVGIIIAASTYS